MDNMELILQELQKLNGKLDGVDQRLDGVDRRLDSMDQRLDGVDRRLDSMDKRLDGVDRRLDGMDQRLDGVDRRLDTLEKQQSGILDEATQRMKVLLDAEVTPKFNLLAEEISIIQEKLSALDDTAQMQDDLFTLKAVVKQHTREINQLKKAQ